MWSPQQETALDRVGRWIQSRDKPWFQLAGYAGTGKTTLAKHLASTVSGSVYFAAYTGKAAHVLIKSGARNVSTIHKLIYTPKDKSQQKLKQLEAERARIRTLNPIPAQLLARVEKAIENEQENLARPFFQLNTESPLNGAALCVVDEYSMIDEQMGKDLLSFGCPILALGDPAQLPPVRGSSFFSGQPDVMLTEIHRQARDNPIIWMSKQVREGAELVHGYFGDSRVIPHSALPREELQAMVLATDQLLVGRNDTRHTSNARVREMLGRTNRYPLKDDKLVCLRNNHDAGLLNGQIWTAREDSINDGKYLICQITGDEGDTLTAVMHPDYFHGRQPDYYTRRYADEFDYGYALTVHKAQGSQWPNVLLLDEWRAKDRRNWLYTAITRASDRIDVVVM